MFVNKNNLIYKISNLCKNQKNNYIQNRHTSAYNIFDRNTKRLQKERAATSKDVELFDYIKDEVGFRLSDRLFDFKRQFKNGADIGCNRGFVSRHVLAETIENLMLCDTSETMLKQAETTPGINVSRHEIDEESLDFKPNSLDIVISNLSLHWVNDLPGCFKTIINSLTEDGVFIASIFGGDTLFELRSSLQLAEIERKGGLSPHISPFTKIQDIGALLNGAGFTMLTIDTDEIVVGYPSMFELLWDLKGMAENNAAFNRPLRIDRDVLAAAAAIYKEMYGVKETKENTVSTDGVSATFQIIYFIGWKPSPKQAKPLPRGSGEVSLKDLGTIIEKGIDKK